MWAQMNMYRLWYEYLRRSDRGQWTARVRANFDGSFASFDEWWGYHKDLFKPLEPFYVDQLHYYENLSQFEGDDMSLIVHVNLYESKRALRKAFGELLDKVHPRKRGKPKFENHAEFPLLSRPEVPTVNYLDKTLDVYDAWINRGVGAGRKRLWEIGDEEKISPDHSITKPKKNADLDYNKRILTILVRKRITAANRILSGVTKGDFPALRKSKS